MSNKHIFDYLDYYLDLKEPPHYAIMLTGSWGIGKSYNVKHYLEKINKQGKSTAYISLYGAESIDDIAVSLFAALLPKQDNKLTKLGGQLGRILWKKLPIFKNTGEAVVDWLPNSMADLIIFDDLERAQISSTKILGFINNFIEHEGHRVLIIANEIEISDKEDYRRIREKVIGMTFELVEQNHDALNHFIDGCEDKDCHDFLNRHRDIIISIFEQSQTKNLRILEQSLRTWERIFKVIDPSLKKKEKGMIAALSLFLALSFEIKSGRIEQKDLTGRLSQIVQGTINKDEGNDGNAISIADNRYSRIYLHSSILTDEVLIQVLCDGRIEPTKINGSLSIDPAFIAPDEEPAWRQVWYGMIRDEEEFAEAFETLENEFSERLHDDAGTVLHIFGLLLWGIEIGHLEKTENDIITECKRYIDDLKKAKRLSRFKPEGLTYSAHGLGFSNKDTQAFKKIREYYSKQAESAYQETWQKLAMSLLDDMKDDGEIFYERICWAKGSSKADCVEDPILSQICPKAFINKLIACHPETQRTIFEGLKERYSPNRLLNDLTEEKEWIIAVYDELQKRLPELTPIRKYSLSKNASCLLESALEQAKDTQTQS